MTKSIQVRKLKDVFFKVKAYRKLYDLSENEEIHIQFYGEVNGEHFDGHWYNFPEFSFPHSSKLVKIKTITGTISFK
jgi:hypothetical protein